MLLLSWLAMVGFDFFLHGGLLARLYQRPSPFLLPPKRAFLLIPVGYLSFLLFALMLFWLMMKLAILGGRPGFWFGLKLGLISWGAFVIGLYSISTAEPLLLAGWLLGQAIEAGIGGAVIGSGMARARLSPLVKRVLALVVLLIILSVVLQNLGWAPALKR